MRNILIGLLIITSPVNAKELKPLYKKVFPKIQNTESIDIPDPINYKPVNTKILIAYSKAKKVLGYIREVKTNTGCDSACLPIVCTLFYDSDKKFLKILSEPGLTKLNHEDFTNDDYFKLETILLRNPSIFKKVTHPYDMVDGITRATTKLYKDSVVPTAAYTTLRLNSYNQHTLKYLKKM